MGSDRPDWLGASVLIEGITILLVLGGLYAMQQFKRALLDNFKDFQSQHIAECNRLKKDIQAVCAGAIGVGERLSKLEAYMDTLSLRQHQADKRDTPLSSYSHAAKMVEMGAREEDIIEHCGLTRAEANLVVMLQQQSTTEEQI